jgi:hypothetical protein
MNADYVASILIVTLGGCGAVDSEPMMMGEDGPVLLASEPGNHATGVRADAPIVLTFSEPMDAASVEAAISAPALGALTFVWDLPQTEVKIIPAAPMEYAAGEGNDPNIVAGNRYEVTIASSALSKDGIPLVAPEPVGFTTLKRMKTLAPLYNELTTHVSDSQVALPGIDIRVGDTTGNKASRGLFSFNLSELSGQAVEIEAATLSATFSVVAEPWEITPTISGYHVSFATAQAGFSIAPLSVMPSFAESSVTSVARDVGAEVNDDLAHRTERGNLSQFRLQFDGGVTNDGGQDYVLFPRNQLELAFTYLAQ